MSKLVRARKDCAAMRGEGAESIKLSSGSEGMRARRVLNLVWVRMGFAEMRDEGAEHVKFSLGSEGLCRNAGEGRGKSQI